MEMNLQPLASTCFVSGEPFVDGARVASYLVRSGATLEIVRYDVLETAAATFAPEGQVACRWVHGYKPRKQGENPDRALKLTAENLFVALADPTTEPTPENTRLVQFLALMLERKKILKPKGKSADGARDVYEHAKSKQLFEVPAGELTPEFFVAVQEQLSVLVGAPKGKLPAAAPGEAAVAASGELAVGSEGAARASEVPAPESEGPMAASEAAAPESDGATTLSEDPAPDVEDATPGVEESVPEGDELAVASGEPATAGTTDVAPEPDAASAANAGTTETSQSDLDAAPAPAGAETK